jgi:hypothetical protein
MHSAQRTLVKSPPELWSEVSDPEALARHLEGFGEIRISRLEPEVTVAWEGDTARGTVSLEPAGWGTKVTLTAEEPEREPELVAEPEPEPIAEVEVEVEQRSTRSGFFARLFRRGREPQPEPAAVVEPEPEPEPALQPEPRPEPTLDAQDTLAALEAVLDDLGAAHHRPFSRG